VKHQQLQSRLLAHHSPGSLHLTPARHSPGVSHLTPVHHSPGSSHLTPVHYSPASSQLALFPGIAERPTAAGQEKLGSGEIHPVEPINFSPRDVAIPVVVQRPPPSSDDVIMASPIEFSQHTLLEEQVCIVS